MNKVLQCLAGGLVLCLLWSIPSCAESVSQRFVKDLWEINARMPDIWPGYKIDTPVLLYFPHDKLSCLIAHPKPPADYVLQEGFDKRVAVYGKRGEMKYVSLFNLNYVLDGIKTVFFRIDDSIDLAQEINVFFHENFHVYQQKTFRYTEHLTGEDRSPEHLALFEIEVMLLKRALISSGSEQLKLMRKFLAVRRARRSEMPVGAIEFENSKETIEGTAEYVGIRSVLPPDNGRGYVLLAAPLLWERWSLLNLANAGDAARYYMSGALQMFILDSLNTPWKSRVQGGTSIFDTIAQYFENGLGGGEVADMKKEFGYDGLVKIAIAAAGKQEGTQARLLDKYNSSPKIIVQLPPQIKGDGPRPYAENIKNGRENIFSNATVEVNAGDYLGLEIKSDMLSWTGAEQPVRDGTRLIYPSQYKVAAAHWADFSLELDRKPVSDVLQEKVSFRSIRFKNMEISLDAKCDGVVYKKDKDICIILSVCGQSR